MSEAQLINQLKFKVATLESALSDKQKEVEQYRNIEEQADGKIKVLNKVHAQKIKSLLNSIQILKKQKAAVENLSKQHKRSKLIEQLNKQILDQDLVIEVLRKHIYDEKGKDKGRQVCDSIIVKALTKGPERIRPLTREELRMEIDRLKAQANTQQTKMKGTKGKVNSEDGDVSEISSVSERSFINQGEEVFVRVRQLQGQNEALKLQLATKGKIIEKLKAESRQRDRFKAQTQLLTNELEVAQRRAETFERLLRQSKENVNKKIAELYTRQLRVQQLELNSKQNGERLKQAHQSANILLEEIRQEKQQLNIELELLKKENQQILLENITLKKRSDQQKNKINEVRMINNKNKEELTEKIKIHEEALQKLIKQHTDLQDAARNMEAKLFKERAEWVEERDKLIKQIEDLQAQHNQAKFDQKTMEEIDQLRKENRDLKEVIESGTGGGSDNSILMQRLENYRMKLEFYEKGESKGLYDELFSKYNNLLAEVEQLKKNGPPQKPKRKNIVEITTKEERDLQGISSGISALHLEDIDSDILQNFDSDYEYELKINNMKDKKFQKLPKLTEQDQQLLKLINSNLWDFVKDEQIQKKIEQIMKDQPSNIDEDLELKKKIRELKNISHPMGKKIKLYDSELINIDNMSESVSVTSALAKQIDNFDSDIDLQIKKNVKGAPNINMKQINAVSDRESQDLDLSSAKSGESSFVKRKKGEKASTLKLNKQSASSVVSSKSSMNSDVSSINVNQSLFKGMDSDVSVDFRRKKTSKK